ncbi:MAG: PKD domain-containing protein [Acidobacteriota bacterium]
MDGDGSSVYQKRNSRPSIYYGDFPAFGSRLSGRSWIGPSPPFNPDDDYFGFVLGFEPGDSTSPDADYVLISWKRESQDGAKKGLRASRIRGIPGSLWNLDSAEGVELLSLAATRGNSVWSWERDYRFTFDFSPERLRVWVDDVLEIDVEAPADDPFDTGRFGFYNNSQDRVQYRAVSRETFFGEEGRTTTVVPFFGDPGLLDTHTATFLWGDGTSSPGVPTSGGEINLISGEYVYAEDGAYTADVCVTDDAGDIGCGRLPVSIANLPPAVTASTAPTQAPGVASAFELATYADPGVLDTHTATVDWGDGAVESVAVEVTGGGAGRIVAGHAYASLGTYAARVCVTDDEGAEACADLEVTVASTAGPTDVVVTTIPALEGDPLTLTATFADPDAGDVHTATVDWGDGLPVEAAVVTQTAGGGTVDADHRYRQDGSYPVEVCVTDASGAVGCGAAVAQVGNASPRVGFVDLGHFTVEDKSGGTAGSWQVSEDGRRARQGVVNASATFLVSPWDVSGNRVSGTLRGERDDDFVGLAFGFEPGDADSASADFIYVAWKGENQSGAAEGLRAYRLRGAPSSFFEVQSALGAEDLGPAATLANVGWDLGVDHRFEAELTPERFRLWIDGTLEIDAAAPVDDPFDDGRFALVNVGQEETVFHSVEVRAADPADAYAAAPWRSAYDLATFTAEDLAGADAADWQVSADGRSVTQSVNSRPSFFLAPEPLFGRPAGLILQPLSDNDWVGLAVGFEPGDGTDSDADYLLLLWKKTNQTGAPEGLRLFRIQGALTSAFEILNSPEATLVAEAANLADAGYQRSRRYDLRVEPTADRLRIWVDGRMEFDVAVDPAIDLDGGHLAFYVAAQQGVTFRDAYVEGWVGFEGDVLPAFAAGFTDPGLDDLHGSEVDRGDGIVEPEVVQQGSGVGTVQVPAQPLADDAYSDGSVCVTDDGGATACGVLPVRAFNLPPVVDAGADGTVGVGATFDLTATFTDPGSADTHSATMDWGDGAVEPALVDPDSREVSASHAWAAEGVYTVEICVNDDDGGAACDTRTVTVAGQADLTLTKVDALADANGDGAANPGEQVTYTLTVSNVGTAPAVAVVLDDPQPAYTSHAGVTGSQGVVTSTSPLQVDLGILDAGAQATVTWTVTVDPSLPDAVDALVNHATVTAAGVAPVISDDPGTPAPADATATPASASTQAVCLGVTDERGCCVDDFGAAQPSTLWTLSEIGDATGGAAVHADGALELTGTGSELYHGDDHAAFLQQEVMADFRVELDVTGVPVDEGGQYRKGGLQVRTDAGVRAPKVTIQYVPHFPAADGSDQGALMFDVRDVQGPNGAGGAYELASTVPGVQLPVRLAVQRRSDLLSVFYSVDGGVSWVRPLGGAGGEVELPLGETVLAGPSVTSYDPSQPLTMAFDDFTVCRPGGARPTPVEYDCDPDAGLDVVVLLDVSDSMARAHGDPAAGVSKLESVRGALLRVLNGLELRTAPTQVAVVSFVGGDDPATNLSFGAVVETTFTDLASAGSLLAGVDLPILDPYHPLTSTTLTQALDRARLLLESDGDPSHGAVVLVASDSLPNVDAEGRGPLAYGEDEVASLGLTDDAGDFLPAGEVVWLGDFNADLGTYDGQVLADAMLAVEGLRDGLGDVRVFSLVPRGSAVYPPLLPEGLADYAAWYAQGGVFGADDPVALEGVAAQLLTALECGRPGPARLEGRVWNDLDRDGAADAGEPGLPGVTVTVDAGGAGQVALVTDADGGYGVLLDPPAAPVTLSVDPASLVTANGATANEPTADPDGVTTPDTASVPLAPWQSVLDADFGYAAPSGGPLQGCIADDFDDGLLDSAWGFAFVGDADQGGAVESNGTLKLSGDGTSAYAGPDHGVVLYRSVLGSFRVEIDVLGYPETGGGAYRKGGVHVRGGLGPDAPRILAMAVPDLDGVPALQFRARAVDGGVGDLAVASNVLGIAPPVRLAIERSGGVYSVQYSVDGGATWSTPAGGFGGSIALDLGAEPLVALHAVSYDADVPVTVELDAFSMCAPDAAP